MNSLDRTLVCLDLSRDDCAVLLSLSDANENAAPTWGTLPTDIVGKLAGRYLIRSDRRQLMITPAGEAILEALDVLARDQTQGQLLHFPVRQTDSVRRTDSKMPRGNCRVIPFREV